MGSQRCGAGLIAAGLAFGAQEIEGVGMRLAPSLEPLCGVLVAILLQHELCAEKLATAEAQAAVPAHQLALEARESTRFARPQLRCCAVALLRSVRCLLLLETSQ